MRKSIRSKGRAVCRAIAVFAVALVAAVAALDCGPVRAGDGKQVPFKETLVLVGFQGNQAFYQGVATHLGRVTAVQTFNPPGSPVFATYVKTAANGDTLVGTLTPDDVNNPFSTGGVTIDGGTGRFSGATGTARYVITAPGGVTTATIVGTISSVGSSK
jgi:hypothetical protein